MAVLMYENPVTVQKDPDTGLLLLVDGNGKRLARAAEVGDLLQLGRNKGVFSGDLPPAVDPRDNPASPPPPPAPVPVDADKQRAESQTAADNPVTNPNTDYTGKNAGSNPAAETLSDREKYALANKSVPTTESSDNVVQGSGPVKNSAPFSNVDAFNRQGLAPNSGGGPTFTSDPTNGERMSNNMRPGQSSEPSLDIDATNQSIVNRITSVGTTDKAGPDSAAGKSTDEKIAKAEKDKEFNIRENILHQYATSTYGITLHVLTAESYNQLAKGGKGLPWLKDAYTLMSSGGRWGERDNLNTNAFRRPPEFKDDFYIEDLSFRTVIGMTSETRGSNGIDFDFTIIEPYGMTLLNRLLLLSKRIDQPNYTENPYVLQIDFFGNTDGGDIVNPIPNITKYIPIKIILVTIKVDGKGTTYTCKATAYNHSAFQQSTASAPADFEIVARTVGDFFAAGQDGAQLKKQFQTKNDQRERIAAINKQAQDRAKKNSKDRAELTDDEQKQIKELEAAYKTSITTKSFAEAYNAHQVFLQEIESIQHPTEIIFEIDKIIAESPIVYSEKTSVSNTALSNPKDKKEAQAAANAQAPKKNSQTPSRGPDTKYEKFNVKAGENILNIIDKVIRSSKYITSQIKDDRETENKEQNILKFFKVIPSVELLNFDAQQNKWSTRIKYKIKTYDAHNYKHPDAPKTDVSTCLKDIRKKYEYTYTGANNDILDFEIKFDALFFNAISVLHENKQSVSNSQESASTGKKDVKAANVKKNKKSKIPAQQQYTIQPNMIVPVVNNQQNMGFNSQQNTDVAIAADIVNSIYTSSSAGDMMNIDLQIIGDPDFIKQDDIFYSPNTESYPPPEDKYTENGSMMTDRGDIFFYIRFRTPVDIDLDTGGLRQLTADTKYLDSDFTGVYRVIMVNNEFKSGQFTQSINAVRIIDQKVIDAVTLSIRERTEKTNATKSGQSNLNKLSANITVTSDVVGPKKEENYNSYSETQKSVLAAVTSNRQEETAAASGLTAQKQTNLQTVVAEGSTLSPDQQARQVAFSRDGTNPPTVEAGPAPVSPSTEPRPLSNDATIASLQTQYNKAANDEFEAKNRLQNANNGYYDSNPQLKNTVIEKNTRLLKNALQTKQDLEKQLALKGATPA